MPFGSVVGNSEYSVGSVVTKLIFTCQQVQFLLPIRFLLQFSGEKAKERDENSLICLRGKRSCDSRHVQLWKIGLAQGSSWFRDDAGPDGSGLGGSILISAGGSDCCEYYGALPQCYELSSRDCGSIT